jgi:Protein kinase domain
VKGSSPKGDGSLIGTRLGNYRLESLIGRGRMGAVYLAHDSVLLRPTAVKILSWTGPAVPGVDPVQWFLSEARMVARINHPRVVQIYGAAQEGKVFYIAMEYVPGESADALIRSGPIAARRATEIVSDAATALAAAHRVGVVHRDVKPANILIEHCESAKLSDFGMALTTSAARAAANIRAGTPHYTAPEIWLGEPATPATDLYALGATYFHLLTGSPPFEGSEDVDSSRRAHLSGAVPDPRSRVPGLPEECARLVGRLMSREPRQRHASAREVSSELRRLLQALGQEPKAQADGSRARSAAALASDDPAAALASADPAAGLASADPAPGLATADPAAGPIEPLLLRRGQGVGLRRWPFIAAAAIDTQAEPAGPGSRTADGTGLDVKVQASELHALDAKGVRGFLEARLAGCGGPGLAPFVLSTDAALLLARRVDGDLGRLELLAENMLVLALADGARVLSSWHAWAASSTVRWAIQERPALPDRPRAWPTAAFLEAIQACRSEAGLPPFPAPGQRATSNEPRAGADARNAPPPANAKESA